MRNVNKKKLTDKQKFFCLFYVQSFNATQAYLKAYGGSYESAQSSSSKMLLNPMVQAEIEKLQSELRQSYKIEFEDYVNYLLKIVGARISDFVNFGNRNGKNFIELKNADSVDDSALIEVRKVKDDVTIKLEDKKWAWEKLAKIFGFEENDKSNIPVVISGENDLED